MGDQDDQRSVRDSLEGSVAHLQFSPGRNWMDLAPRSRGTELVSPVGNLRESLVEQDKINLEPKRVRVTGTFFPAALLSSGWWERDKKRVKRRVDPAPHAPPGLRQWLLRGFEEWGPSWDFSPDLSDGGQASILFGQIADGDEVNSLPVVISAGKAAPLQRNELPEQQPFPVELRGLLCHRDSEYLQGEELAKKGTLLHFGKAFQYILLVEDRWPKHEIARLPDSGEPYTGYLWQCWAPAELLVNGDIPSVDQVFFVWEHTDLSNADALRYNLDSLQHKGDYLERVMGKKMALLFKSSAVVPGKPRLSRDEFYRSIAAGFGCET
jgi:hypothetical protein